MERLLLSTYNAPQGRARFPRGHPQDENRAPEPPGPHSSRSLHTNPRPAQRQRYARLAALTASTNKPDAADTRRRRPRNGLASKTQQSHHHRRFAADAQNKNSKETEHAVSGGV